MGKPIINQWHCEECEEIFYNELGKVPNHCPYCQSHNLTDSKMWEIERLTFKKD